METLPRGSLLVRTWFGDDEAWQRLARAITVPSEDGFLADVTAVDDPAYASLDAGRLRELTPDGPLRPSVSFLADEPALTTDGWPMQVVALGGAQSQPFRVVATELWSVENNLNLSNMDWIEFAEAADPDGVFRGFRLPGR
ncbi:MAG TPA: hypothetical protein VMB79_05285 [Jatrophihabitans sp.]|nr:hypothetical protein [Jatrophihabitans sp.]